MLPSLVCAEFSESDPFVSFLPQVSVQHVSFLRMLTHSAHWPHTSGTPICTIYINTDDDY